MKRSRIVSFCSAQSLHRENHDLLLESIQVKLKLRRVVELQKDCFLQSHNISLLIRNAYTLGYNMTSSSFRDVNSSVLTYHRIIESFKFSYAWRSRLGDPWFDSRINKVSKEQLLSFIRTLGLGCWN